jgi:xanthine dehydrogenase accessory factor
VFATRARFPDADEVVVRWPHEYLAETVVDERTVICVLTHDPKFDVPLLEVALRLPAVAYIGAMGSRRTHHDRLERLRAAGLTEEELARLSSPIGLDLGARTPEETAISIAAEIIALQWGGRGDRLATLDGPIHHHEHPLPPAPPEPAAAGSTTSGTTVSGTTSPSTTSQRSDR